MPFDNSIKNIQTPGRLHALCKLVQHDSYTKEELRKLLQPESLNPGSDFNQFKEVWRLAEKGDLLRINDQGKVILTVTPKDGDITELVAFRQWIWRVLIVGTDFVFNKFTAWFVQRGEGVLSDNAARLEMGFFRDVSSKYTDKREYNASVNIPAWMNWASFLGLGYAHSGIFIPNAAGRLRESMNLDPLFSKSKWIRMIDFNAWLQANCPELQTVGESHVYTLAVSAGLRTLHDIGFIRLETGVDTTNAWYLTDNGMHAIPGLVTSFEILGGVSK